MTAKFSVGAFASLASLALLAGFTGKADAQLVVYSNITTFSGSGFANGGAAVSGGDTITAMVADDITWNNTPENEKTANVTGLTFSVGNFNTAAVSARPIVEFFNNNGTSGGPGTLLGGLIFNPISFTAGTVQLFNYDPNTPIFALPTSGTFWAGMTFDNNTGTTGATAAQLNLLGQGLFNPPTIGSSQDAFFQSSAGGAIPGSNPAGGFFFFGGNPVANFGWSFQVSPLPTPEPGSLAALVGLAIPGIGFAIRRRARKNA